MTGIANDRREEMWLKEKNRRQSVIVKKLISYQPLTVAEKAMLNCMKSMLIPLWESAISQLEEENKQQLKATQIRVDWPCLGGWRINMTTRMLARRRKRGKKRWNNNSKIIFHTVTNHTLYFKYWKCSDNGFLYKNPCMNKIPTHVKRFLYNKVGSLWPIVAMVAMIKAIGQKPQNSMGGLSG